MKNLCLSCFHYHNGKCTAQKGYFCKILRQTI